MGRVWEGSRPGCPRPPPPPASLSLLFTIPVSTSFWWLRDAGHKGPCSDPRPVDGSWLRCRVGPGPSVPWAQCPLKPGERGTLLRDWGAPMLPPRDSPHLQSPLRAPSRDFLASDFPGAERGLYPLGLSFPRVLALPRGCLYQGPVSSLHHVHHSDTCSLPPLWGGSPPRSKRSEGESAPQCLQLSSQMDRKSSFPHHPHLPPMACPGVRGFGTQWGKNAPVQISRKKDCSTRSWVSQATGRILGAFFWKKVNSRKRLISSPPAMPACIFCLDTLPPVSDKGV